MYLFMQVLERTSRYVTVKIPIQQYNTIIDELCDDDISEYEFQFREPIKASSLISA